MDANEIMTGYLELPRSSRTTGQEHSVELFGEFLRIDDRCPFCYSGTLASIHPSFARYLCGALSDLRGALKDNTFFFQLCQAPIQD